MHAFVYCSTNNLRLKIIGFIFLHVVTLPIFNSKIKIPFMHFIDTHAHLYLQDFDENVVPRSIEAGVLKIVLPAIDSSTHTDLIKLTQKFPENCYGMMGVHPCSIKENYKDELDIARRLLEDNKFIAVGEIGLDYYWDTSYTTEQQAAFDIQMSWALDYNLPISIHSRNSMDDTIAMIQRKQNGNLRGIFHCFSGTTKQAQQIIDAGLYLGIGGVVTYKKSGLAEAIKPIPLQHLVLETDAPFLTPVPFRGKKNESAYIVHIANALSDIYEIAVEQVATITTTNAEKIFNI